MSPFPLSNVLARRLCSQPCLAGLQQKHVRRATLIARPRRMFQFTQLVRLTDGSTYTHRTTSPQPVFAPPLDTYNSLMWQPANKRLRRIEVDEAGKLAAFRGRFGRGFDLENLDDATTPPPHLQRSVILPAEPAEQQLPSMAGLLSLISDYAGPHPTQNRVLYEPKVAKRRKGRK